MVKRIVEPPPENAVKLQRTAQAMTQPVSLLPQDHRPVHHWPQPTLLAGPTCPRRRGLRTLRSPGVVGGGFAASASDQLDGLCGIDRRHAWSGRNSIGGERQHRKRKRAEKPQDCYTHINLPEVSAREHENWVAQSVAACVDSRQLMS
jgi:hypothetical protein